jgi:hypothetical protein
VPDPKLAPELWAAELSRELEFVLVQAESGLGLELEL